MPNSESVLPAIPSALKYRNRELILSCFRDNQEHSVGDIVARTGISKLTVMRAIQFFCRKGILISSGKGESTEQGGKRPEYFRFGCKKYLLTIMLWPETLGLTLFDMELHEICRSSFSWIIPATPDQAFSFVREQAMALLNRTDIRCEDLYGVSLSTSGIVDYDSLVLKYRAMTSPSDSTLKVYLVIHPIISSKMQVSASAVPFCANRKIPRSECSFYSPLGACPAR